MTTAQERWEFDTGILFLPFLLEEPGTKLAYAGESLGEDGKPRDVITVSFDAEDTTRRVTYHVSVDRESNLIDRIEIQKAGKGDNERLGYAARIGAAAAGSSFPARCRTSASRVRSSRSKSSPFRMSNETYSCHRCRPVFGAYGAYDHPPV